jgi:hypothetical protein
MKGASGNVDRIPGAKLRALEMSRIWPKIDLGSPRNYADGFCLVNVILQTQRLTRKNANDLTNVAVVNFRENEFAAPRLRDFPGWVNTRGLGHIFPLILRLRKLHISRTYMSCGSRNSWILLIKDSMTRSNDFGNGKNDNGDRVR